MTVRCLVVLPLFLGLSSALCTLEPSSIFQLRIPNIFGDLAIYRYRYFRMEAEVNYPYLNNTFYVKEYFDLKEGRGRVEIQEGGKSNIFVYFNNTGETFYVQDDICEEGQVDDTPPFEAELVESWVGRTSSGLPVLGPSAMFLLGKNRYQTIGLSKEKIRGLSAWEWKACDQNLTLRYFFNYAKSLPLRVEVVGYEADNEDYPRKDQHYEILVYERYKTSPEIDALLQVPTGVGCQRTATGLPVLPKLENNNVYLGLEFIATYFTPGDELPPTYLTNGFVLNDRLYELLVYGYTDWVNGSVGDPKLVIYDLKSGYVYTLDEDTGACDIKRPFFFKPTIPFPSEKGMETTIELLEPNFIFGTKNYTYLGEYYTRGIKSVIYERYSGCKNTKDLEEYCSPVIVTREYEEKTSPSDTAALFPIRLTIKMVNSLKDRTELFKISTNVYNLHSRLEDRYKFYDVSECFSHHTESVMLRYTFPEFGVDQLPLMQAVAQVKQQMVSEICLLGDINPLRLPRVSVDFDEEGMHVSMRLLERTPYLFDFRASGQYKLDCCATQTAELVGLNDCARLCLNSNCAVFSLCGTSCRVGRDGGSGNPPRLVKDSACSFYRRDTTVASNPTVAQLTQIFNTAFQNDQLPSFSMEIDFDGTTLFKNLEPYKMTISKQEDDSVKKIANFDVVYKTYRRRARLEGNGVRPLSALSPRDCQKVCLASPDCHAVSFCYGLLTQCAIGLVAIDDLHPLITNDTRCEVFTKNYLAQFVELPGSVLEIEGKPRTTSSAEACAQQCIKSTDSAKCRSFDFCASLDGLECYLHSFHDGELNTAVKKKDRCSHYSRSYVADYTTTPEKMIKSGRGTAVYGLGATECARRCSEHGENKICTAFDVCSTGGHDSCHLALGGESIDLLSNPHCTYYKRAYIHEEAPKEGTLYSNGLAGGMSFIFIVVGFCLGVFFIFLYRRYRPK